MWDTWSIHGNVPRHSDFVKQLPSLPSTMKLETVFETIYLNDFGVMYFMNQIVVHKADWDRILMWQKQTGFHKQEIKTILPAASSWQGRTFTVVYAVYTVLKQRVVFPIRNTSTTVSKSLRFSRVRIPPCLNKKRTSMFLSTLWYKHLQPHCVLFSALSGPMFTCLLLSYSPATFHFTLLPSYNPTLWRTQQPINCGFGLLFFTVCSQSPVLHTSLQ